MIAFNVFSFVVKRKVWVADELGLHRNLLASRSDSRRVRISPSRTAPFTLRMICRFCSPRNSTFTWVHWPCEPVRPRILVTCNLSKKSFVNPRNLKNEEIYILTHMAIFKELISSQKIYCSSSPAKSSHNRQPPDWHLSKSQTKFYFNWTFKIIAMHNVKYTDKYPIIH